VFFTRPISGTIVAFTTVVLLLPFIQKLRARYLSSAHA
jgi:TctA family transporter